MYLKNKAFSLIVMGTMRGVVDVTSNGVLKMFWLYNMIRLMVPPNIMGIRILKTDLKKKVLHVSCSNFTILFLNSATKYLL
jgi:hypothetical protein